MPNVTVSVSKELKKKMDGEDELNWSAVARKAFEDKLENLDELNELRTIVAKSKLTERDVEEINQKIRAERRRAVKEEMDANPTRR